MILMIYTSFSSFIKADYEILAQKYKVKKYQYLNTKTILSHFFNQIKIFLWLILNIHQCKAVYIWFSDYHAFFPVLFCKIFRKKSFIVLGGYDVTYIPEIHYGSINNKIRKGVTLWAIKNASCNLAVSKYVLNQAVKLVPTINVVLLYNGVDLSIFKLQEGKKKDQILTVGIIDSERRIKLKGIDVFVKIVKEMPDFEFIIVGMTETIQNILGDIPKNLKIFDQMPHAQLNDFYNEAKVYCQFSLVESFCLTLAEAMACGCVGVVTNAGALPEIVGNSGFIIEKNNLAETKEAIREAMRLNKQKSDEAMKMINTNFGLIQRTQNIFKILNEYGIN
ncbi:MAG: glycosyltransferase family 4 protein [Ignavibacteriae bacterium]|nr:glycosyltransferase family 4 protein [Ignavibacteriota bacterium]